MATGTDLKELRVAVTGGTSGLGMALVRRLIGRGAQVAFVARNAEAVERIGTETVGTGSLETLDERKMSTRSRCK